MSNIATSAPASARRSAIARPIPPPPPVTNAACPSRRARSVIERDAHDRAGDIGGIVADQIGGEMAERVAGLARQYAVHPNAVARPFDAQRLGKVAERSEEHTSELQSLMRTYYAVLSLKK